MRFFLAGPTHVASEVRQAMTAPAAAHRSAGFLAVYQEMSAALRPAFRTAEEVLTLTGSATLGLEAALRSTVARRALHLVNGAFSERWHAIGVGLGLESERLDVPWGRAIDPEAVRRAVAGGGYEAVTLAHNETSTGALSPLAEIAAAVREASDALVLVDAVSSLGGAAVETDAWGLDAVVTASQKALALPPGLTFVTLSPRARERAAAVAHRGYTTDLLRHLEKHRQGGPLTTPAMPQVHAARVGLRRVLAEGLEARWRRHRELRRRVAGWAAERGLIDATAADAASPTVSCLRPPSGLPAPDVVRRLADRGFTVAGGYGAWKPDTFRIGHMGEVQPVDLEALFAALDEALAPVSTATDRSTPRARSRARSR